MFNDQTEIDEKFRKNTVAIKEISVQNVYRLVLCNDKTIVYKRKNGNGNF